MTRRIRWQGMRSAPSQSRNQSFSSRAAPVQFVRHVDCVFSVNAKTVASPAGDATVWPPGDSHTRALTNVRPIDGVIGFFRERHVRRRTASTPRSANRSLAQSEALSSYGL